MTAEDHAIIWEGWHSGRSLSDISQELLRSPSMVFDYLRHHGGIEPAALVDQTNTHFVLGDSMVDVVFIL